MHFMVSGRGEGFAQALPDKAIKAIVVCMGINIDQKFLYISQGEDIR